MKKDTVVLLGFGEQIGQKQKHIGDILNAQIVTTPVNRFDISEYQYLTDEYKYGIGISLGGLILSHLTMEHSFYVSPWWGTKHEKFLFPLKALFTLKTTKKIIPLMWMASKEDIGPTMSNREWKEIPKFISPSFMEQTYRLQQNIEIDPKAEIYCSLEDSIISLKKIGSVGDSSQIHLYNGKHSPHHSNAFDVYWSIRSSIESLRREA